MRVSENVSWLTLVGIRREPSDFAMEATLTGIKASVPKTCMQGYHPLSVASARCN
jgi:hypothetical protein